MPRLITSVIRSAFPQVPPTSAASLGRPPRDRRQVARRRAGAGLPCAFPAISDSSTLASRSALASQVNRAPTAWARSAMTCRRSGSPARSSALASAVGQAAAGRHQPAGQPVAHRVPQPGTSKATAGVPSALASITVSPQPSASDGATVSHARLSRSLLACSDTRPGSAHDLLQAQVAGPGPAARRGPARSPAMSTCRSGQRRSRSGTASTSRCSCLCGTSLVTTAIAGVWRARHGGLAAAGGPRWARCAPARGSPAGAASRRGSTERPRRTAVPRYTFAADPALEQPATWLNGQRKYMSNWAWCTWCTTQITAVPAGAEQRGEERDAVLEVDHRVVLVPVPPQVAGRRQVHAEPAALAAPPGTRSPSRMAARPGTWR